MAKDFANHIDPVCLKRFPNPLRHIKDLTLATLRMLTLILICVLLEGQFALSQEPIKLGEQAGGTYQFGDARIRFFVFYYTGVLDDTEISKVASNVLRSMQDEGKTAVVQRYSKYDPTGRSGSRRIWLKEGDVLVLGWADKVGSKCGWIAADTDGYWTEARHRWISNSGKSGAMVALGEAHGVPRTDKTAKLYFRTGKEEKSRIYLQLFANEGRLTWWMSHPADSVAPLK